MANPFYHSHRNPIRHGYYPQAQIQPQSSKPKVINIPVHFIGSDDAASKQSPATASASPVGEVRIAPAVTIQRAVRGFLVRKNARVVRQVLAEVEEIERKMREEEAKIRLDDRQRLVVSETLMALLLRLDSVRGVRDFRKRVVRRVIGLQEMIDSISAAVDEPISSIDMEEDPEGSREEAYEKITDRLDPDEEEELGREIPLAVESLKRIGDLIATVEGTASTSGTAEDLEVSRITAAEEASIDHEKTEDQTIVPEEETYEADTNLEMDFPVAVESPERQSDLIGAAADGTISAGDREGSVEEAEESSIDHGKAANETLGLEEEMNEAKLEVEIRAAAEPPKRKSDLIGIEIGEDGLRSPEAEEEGTSMVVESMTEVASKREEGGGMREMVEKMAVENERLKGMMAQLCATSSEQCRLMEGLVDRVEHLERVVHHRMDRRKKRRSITACSALSSAK